jgi:hypothetical protein
MKQTGGKMGVTDVMPKAVKPEANGGPDPQLSKLKLPGGSDSKTLKVVRDALRRLMSGKLGSMKLSMTKPGSEIPRDSKVAKALQSAAPTGGISPKKGTKPASVSSTHAGGGSV